MNKKELSGMMAVIQTAYPNFNPTPERMLLWYEKLKDIPFLPAMEVLNQYIDTNDFYPGISNIKKHFVDPADPEVYERDRMIAHQAWVNAGNDPEVFVYERDNTSPRLTS